MPFPGHGPRAEPARRPASPQRTTDSQDAIAALSDIGELGEAAGSGTWSSGGRAGAGHSGGVERADALGQIIGQAAQQVAARGGERLRARVLRHVASFGASLVAA